VDQWREIANEGIGPMRRRPNIIAITAYALEGHKRRFEGFGADNPR
jgi:hypothetical protein